MCISIHKHPPAQWHTYYSINFNNHNNSPYISCKAVIYNNSYMAASWDKQEFLSSLVVLQGLDILQAIWRIQYRFSHYFSTCTYAFVLTGNNRLYLIAIAVLSAISDDLIGTFWIMAVSKSII